jgi:hypothetical protein
MPSSSPPVRSSRGTISATIRSKGQPRFLPFRSGRCSHWC